MGERLTLLILPDKISIARNTYSPRRSRSGLVLIIMQRAVVLLSGGLDSTTVAAKAKADQREIYALTIDYNQRHRTEIEAAKRVAAWLGVKRHVIMPINLRLFGGSSLTDTISVPKNVDTDQIGIGIPNTYVPARNTIFLSLALALAETVDAGEIYIGVSSVDYSGYPDCRPEFLQAFENCAEKGTRRGTEQKGRFAICAPLMSMSKAEIIRLGFSLGVDYSLTQTCYDPTEDGKSCDACEACLLRRKGFQEAGVPDPNEVKE